MKLSKALKFIITILAFLVLSLNVNADQINQHDFSHSKLKLQNKHNVCITSMGSTISNYIYMKNCSNIKLTLDRVNILTNSNIPIGLYNSKCTFNLNGKNKICSKETLRLNSSNIDFIGKGSLDFNGIIYINTRSKISFSPETNVIFTAPIINNLDFSNRNIVVGNGYSSFISAKLSNRTDISKNLIVTAKGTNNKVTKSFELPINHSAFALNLPSGKYNISVKDSNSTNYKIYPSQIKIDGFAYKKNFKISTLEKLTINKIETTHPTSPTSNNGKIVISAKGGSGEYLYSVGESFQKENVFNKLSQGKYVLTVKDINTQNSVSKEITLTAPYNTKLKFVKLDNTLFNKTIDNENFQYEVSVPAYKDSANISCKTIDSRARIEINNDNNTINLNYGDNLFPIKITTGDKSLTYVVNVKRQPPVPIPNNLPLDWVKAPFNLSLDYPNNDKSSHNIEIYSSINNSELNLCNNIEFKSSGIYKIKAYSQIDNIKSQLSNTWTVKIDSTPPVITSATFNGKSNSLGNFFGTTTCTVNANDLHSGIDYISYKLGNNDFQKVYNKNDTYQFNIPNNYSGNVSIKATDKCGNISSEFFTENICVDCDKPYIVETLPKNNSETSSTSYPEIKFSENVHLNSNEIYYTKDEGQPIYLDSKQISIDKNKATLAIPLNHDCNYLITIGNNSFTDICGNPLNNRNITWNFSTSPSPFENKLQNIFVNNIPLNFDSNKQHYFKQLPIPKDIQISAECKNPHSTIKLYLYRNGKEITSFSKNQPVYNFKIDKEYLLNGLNRIIISVISENIQSKTNYVLDCTIGKETNIIQNSTNLVPKNVAGLNQSDDLSLDISKDSNAHFELLIKNILLSPTINHFFDTIENIQDISGYSFEINKVVGDNYRKLEKFNPITITLPIKTNQKIYKINNCNKIKNLSTTDNKFISEITDLDKNQNTISFAITKPEKLVVVTYKEYSHIKSKTKQNSNTIKNNFTKINSLSSSRQPIENDTKNKYSKTTIVNLENINSSILKHSCYNLYFDKIFNSYYVLEKIVTFCSLPQLRIDLHPCICIMLLRLEDKNVIIF